MSEIEDLRRRILEAEAGRDEDLEFLKQCNDVCVCGCPHAEHESCGEDGESCNVEDHQCIRTCIAIRDLLKAAAARESELRDRLKQAVEAMKAVLYPGCSVTRVQTAIAAAESALASSPRP